MPATAKKRASPKEKVAKIVRVMSCVLTRLAIKTKMSKAETLLYDKVLKAKTILNEIPHLKTNKCDECGDCFEEIIGCPDGAEICQGCFDQGLH